MKNCYLLSILMSGIVTVGSAQIVYTDINPDEVYTADQMYFLDVNNDGTDDYIIEQVDSTINGNPLEGVQLRSIGSVNEAIYETTTLTFLASIPQGNVIDGTELWTVPTPSLPAGGVIFVPSPIPAGDWADAQEHYAGIRFTVGASLYYGWVRFKITSDALSFTMMDYAFRSTTDQPLLAGATVDGVEENVISDFSFMQNGASVTISNVNSSLSSIEIFDLTGKMVMNENMNASSRSFDLSAFGNGIYIIRCSNENGMKEFKIVLNK